MPKPAPKLINQEEIGFSNFCRGTDKSKDMHLQLTFRLIEPRLPTVFRRFPSLFVKPLIVLFKPEIALLIPPTSAPVAASTAPFN